MEPTTQAASLADWTLAFRLGRVACAKIRAHIELITTSAHGTELLDLHHQVGADLVRNSDRAFIEIVARLISEQRSDPPRSNTRKADIQTAALINAALHGLELELIHDPTNWQTGVRALANLLANGVL